MTDVESSRQGAPTSNTDNSNYTPNTGSGPSAYIARHPDSFEAEQVTKYWDVETRAKQISEYTKQSSFVRTPNEVEFIKGQHRRRNAESSMMSRDCGCTFPFTDYHRNVCMGPNR